METRSPRGPVADGRSIYESNGDQENFNDPIRLEFPRMKLAREA